VLNLDHNGCYQGVYDRFDTKKEAKTFVETKPDTIRCGLIGFRYHVWTDTNSTVGNLIFESSNDVSYSTNRGYYVEEDEEENSHPFNQDLNKAMDFIDDYLHILSDGIFED
jgi:hypothetical protein